MAIPGWERSTALFAVGVVRGAVDARVPRSRLQWRIEVQGPERPQIETMARNQYHWLISLRRVAQVRSAELVKAYSD